MDPADLGELIRRANAGDAGSRTEVLRQLYAVVRKQIFFLVPRRAVAEDAVQEAMIAIHRALASFRGEANPRTWAITIAIRSAHRQLRKERRHQASDEEPDVSCFDLDQRAAAELVLLRRALLRLAEKKREAFVLMGLLDLSANEAGKALGTFANTVASRYRHARAELEQFLGQGGTSAPALADGAPVTKEKTV
jgi:RNA polymerase sigma-70 factor, ECF subfamily